MGVNLRQYLFRFAFRRLRVFPVIGWGGGEPWQAFSCRDDVEPSQAPHDTDVVVLAGEIPSQWQDRVRALIETVALPRAVIWLRPPGRVRPPEGLAIGRLVPAEQICEFELTELLPLLAHRERANLTLLGKDRAADWRGEGPYAQGGHGSIGGRPFGRALARPAEDSDQLALDDVPLLLGPHLPCLPPGLQVSLRLQGDRIRACEAVHNAFPLAGLHGEASHKIGVANVPALEALRGRPVTIAALERARLYNHLCWMADFLVLAGLPGWAAQLRRQRYSMDLARLRRLLRPIEASLRPLLQGIAPVTAAEARHWELVGPVARASGVAEDARSGDAGYNQVGFEPVLEPAGDLWARWRLRSREALQALLLIERAGSRTSHAAEGPRGVLALQGSRFIAPTALNLRLLQARLAGMDWQTAILFIASLDLCMEEAALQ